jgi:hypothetical protein
MESSGRGVRVVGTPEDPNVGVGGSGAEKSKVGVWGLTSPLWVGD